MAINTVTGQAIEDAHTTIWARVTQYGSLLAQSNFTSIKYSAYDASNVSVIADSSFTVASVIYDTGQTKTDDPAWPHDRAYNFRADLAATAFPTGDAAASIVVTFTLTDGTVGKLKYVVDNVVAQPST